MLKGISKHPSNIAESAVNPEANCEDLILALKSTGKEFPKILRDRLVEMSPTVELKAALSDNLLTWGDIGLSV